MSSPRLSTIDKLVPRSLVLVEQRLRRQQRTVIPHGLEQRAKHRYDKSCKPLLLTGNFQPRHFRRYSPLLTGEKPKFKAGDIP
jgi:hypothetical protein